MMIFVIIFLVYCISIVFSYYSLKLIEDALLEPLETNEYVIFIPIINTIIVLFIAGLILYLYFKFWCKK
jgi:hypothetical protein